MFHLLRILCLDQYPVFWRFVKKTIQAILFWGTYYGFWCVFMGSLQWELMSMHLCSFYALYFICLFMFHFVLFYLILIYFPVIFRCLLVFEWEIKRKGIDLVEVEVGRIKESWRRGNCRSIFRIYCMKNLFSIKIGKNIKSIHIA